MEGQVVELEEQDIPGASVEEPFDIHNVTALGWWIQCYGIKTHPFGESISSLPSKKKN